MFAGRFGCYPPDKVIVVTKMVDGAEAFDQSARYPIVRVPLLRNGPPHYEWAGMVWDFIKTGWKLIRQHQIERIECADLFPKGSRRMCCQSGLAFRISTMCMAMKLACSSAIKSSAS